MKKVLMSMVAVLLVVVFACSFTACDIGKNTNGGTTTGDGTTTGGNGGTTTGGDGGTTTDDKGNGTIAGEFKDVDLNKNDQKENLTTTLAD